MTRMTSSMHRSLAERLDDLDARISTLKEQQRGVDDSVDATALLAQLTRERTQLEDAMREVTLIDDEPFDDHAIEVGDTVSVRGSDGEVESYVLVDDALGVRARSDWVSVGSPLGRAILGRSQGDRVEVESPQGRLTYEVLHFERSRDRTRPSDALQDAQPTEASFG